MIFLWLGVNNLLDTIIVGGGPAGLSAALVLGRCLRKVLVCDAGHPRDEPARVFNGYLSRDGSTPAEFLEISREQSAFAINNSLVEADAASGALRHAAQNVSCG